MYNYKLQFGYPENYRPTRLEDGFDLNSREEVEVFTNQALQTLSKRKNIRFTPEEVVLFGAAIELTLQDDLQGIKGRERLLDYTLDNYQRAVRTIDKISRGIAARKNKEE